MLQCLPLLDVSVHGAGLCDSAGGDVNDNDNDEDNDDNGAGDGGLRLGLRQPPRDHGDTAVAGDGGAAEHWLRMGLRRGPGYVSRGPGPTTDTCQWSRGNM